MSEISEKDTSQDQRLDIDHDMNRRKSRGQYGKELSEYIHNLYVSGAKLWTKEMLGKIEEELSKTPLPSSVMIPTMDGKWKRKDLPRGIGSSDNENERKHIVIIFNLYQELLYQPKEDYSEKGMSLMPEGYIEEFDEQRKLSYACALNIGWTEGRLLRPTIEYPRLRATWDNAWRNWTQNSKCEELVTIFKEKFKIPRKLKHMVCFALGSPDWGLDNTDNCDSRSSRCSMAQHAAALTMATLFGELLGTGPLPILVQDPAYTPAAKDLLKELGIEVVDGHGSLAFTHVDDDTVVFSCSPNIPVKQVVADIARPAAMIWNSVRPSSEESHEWTIEVMDGGEQCKVAPWVTDEDSPRTRKLVEDYDTHAFPDDPELFPDLEIYVRRD